MAAKESITARRLRLFPPSRGWRVRPFWRPPLVLGSRLWASRLALAHPSLRRGVLAPTPLWRILFLLAFLPLFFASVVALTGWG